MNRHIEAIIGEIKAALENADCSSKDLLVTGLINSKRVFIAGSGRTGLIIKTFAVRLAHLGINVSPIGDTILPPIKKGDLLLIASASGNGASLTGIAKKALAAGADVFLITASANSVIANLCGNFLTINAPTKETLNSNSISAQPMGSLFEQSLLILLDSLVLVLMERLDVTAKEMYNRHANLE